MAIEMSENENCGDERQRILNLVNICKPTKMVSVRMTIREWTLVLVIEMI